MTLMTRAGQVIARHDTVRFRVLTLRKGGCLLGLPWERGPRAKNVAILVNWPSSPQYGTMYYLEIWLH
jgi:hypothetical protein